MSLVPVDSSNQIGLYNNNKIGTISNPNVLSYAPKTDCPIDPKNDLLPPAYTSPLIDMKFGPPEQTVKRYFSLTVEDIDSFHKLKIRKWIKVYEKVLGHCFRKIREHVLRDQKFCFFPVPEYLAGFPLYNITHCTCFIIKKLNQAGFKTKFIPPNVIYIFWNVQNHYEQVIRPSEQKLITASENTQSSQRVQNMSQTMKPQLEKDVHYISLNPGQNNTYQTNTYQSNTFQQRPQQTITNNNKYAFQKEEQFLFG